MTLWSVSRARGSDSATRSVQVPHTWSATAMLHSKRCALEVRDEVVSSAASVSRSSHARARVVRARGCRSRVAATARRAVLGEEDLAGGVHRVEQPLVQASPPPCGARKHTTLNGTRPPARMPDPRPPTTRTAAQAAVLRQPRAQPVGAEVPQHHPQLQRAEAASELHAGVHKVPHRRGFRRSQVLGRRARRRAAERPCAGSRTRSDRTA